MTLSRRDLLVGAVVAGTAGIVGPALFWRNAEAKIDKEQFVVPLKVPPALDSRKENGVRIFDLELQHGQSNFFSNISTPTAGINGSYLGPVVRVRRGDRVRLNVVNQLSEASTLHWHGVHLPAKMDGGPHQIVRKGETWSPEFEIRQPASTQWYHSHMYHRTGIQVYQGLAGLFYIDDEQADSLNLPSEYGIDDIPLVLQDRAFNRDGTFRYASSMHDRMNGMMGNYMLVNGTLSPRLNVQRRLMRFRILNGSNARIYNLEFSDGREFMQIATDGGLLSHPVPLSSVRLAPGERAEIVVDFAPDDDVLLQHKPLPLRRSVRGGMMGMMRNMMSGDDQPFSIMRFDASKALPSTKKIPNRLVDVRNWSESNAVKTRRFVLDMQMGMRMMQGGGFTINGKSMALDRIDETVRLGDVEIWEFINNSPMPHPIHIHDIQFRVLDRDGKQPSANEQGLKDTVLVNSDETVRVITQFENYTDPTSPYMFHCHNLEHEDAGMMGQFLVTG